MLRGLQPPRSGAHELCGGSGNGLLLSTDIPRFPRPSRNPPFETCAMVSCTTGQCFRGQPIFQWGTSVFCRACDLAMEWSETTYVLQSMPMGHPGQAGGLQGRRGVSCGGLAVNVLGIGSGWQQNKQNRAPLAVEGQWSRMGCSDLCRGERSSLRLLFVRRAALQRAPAPSCASLLCEPPGAFF